MKLLRIVGLVLVVFLMSAGFACAQGTGPSSALLAGGAVGAGFGAGITIIGAGYGFGRIGSAALESMARQPEVAGRVQTAMIVIAALLEGATFFALLVCIQLVAKATF
jgi:F-type H+-transporting ATPase subunit c